MQRMIMMVQADKNNDPNAADYDSFQKYDEACRLYFWNEMFTKPAKPISQKILDMELNKKDES
jgi:hypothetical protein